MKRTISGAAAAVSLAISSPAVASEEGWDTASSIGRNGLVIAALAVPVVQGDWTGAKQAVLTIGSTRLVTDGLKYAIEAERPDLSDDDSFPSGHTSMSFAAAATLGRRYGWEAGLPAHVVAAFVGLARVEAKKHHVEDVIVGAVIGEAAGWLLTTPEHANVQFFPWASTQAAGAHVVMRF